MFLISKGRVNIYITSKFEVNAFSNLSFNHLLTNVFVPYFISLFDLHYVIIKIEMMGNSELWAWNSIE